MNSWVSALMKEGAMPCIDYPAICRILGHLRKILAFEGPRIAVTPTMGQIPKKVWVKDFECRAKPALPIAIKIKLNGLQKKINENKTWLILLGNALKYSTARCIFAGIISKYVRFEKDILNKAITG